MFMIIALTLNLLMNMIIIKRFSGIVKILKFSKFTISLCLAILKKCTIIKKFKKNSDTILYIPNIICIALTKIVTFF